MNYIKALKSNNKEFENNISKEYISKEIESTDIDVNKQYISNITESYKSILIQKIENVCDNFIDESILDTILSISTLNFLSLLFLKFLSFLLNINKFKFHIFCKNLFDQFTPTSDH